MGACALREGGRESWRRKSFQAPAPTGRAKESYGTSECYASVGLRGRTQRKICHRDYCWTALQLISSLAKPQPRSEGGGREPRGAASRPWPTSQGGVSWGFRSENPKRFQRWHGKFEWPSAMRICWEGYFEIVVNETWRPLSKMGGCLRQWTQNSIDVVPTQEVAAPTRLWVWQVTSHTLLEV